MHDRRFTVSRGVELRARGEGKILAGWPVVYNEQSELLYGSFREVIAPGAFDEYLRSGPDLMALVEHDRDRILGRTSAKTLRVMMQEQGIEVEVDTPDTSYARDLAESVRRGDIRGMSFAFDVAKDAWTRQDGIPLRTVTQAMIYEVSFTCCPAYPATDASVRSLRTWLESGEAGSRRRRMVLVEKC